MSPTRFCLDCKELTTNSSRCQKCQAALNKRMNSKGNTKARGLGGTHRRKAEKIVKAATVCYICGRPPTPDDPLTADHTVPRAHGGADSPLLAAHRSCNSRRGAQTRRGPLPE